MNDGFASPSNFLKPKTLGFDWAEKPPFRGGVFFGPKIVHAGMSEFGYEFVYEFTPHVRISTKDQRLLPSCPLTSTRPFSTSFPTAS